VAVEVVTFGCRLNAGEADAIHREAMAAGLRDTVIINACAVTSEAMAQARQSVRRIRRAQPQTRIVVTGCAAQVDPKMFAAMPEVDRVVGNDDKMHGHAWLKTAAALSGDAREKIAVSDIMSVKMAAPQRVRPIASGLPRAFVQVQTGCDHRCTFCVIPFGRGNSRSTAADDVVADVRALVTGGHAEIVLTGVDLTAYGRDLGEAPSLGGLAKRILREVPDLQRLRISSIDAAEADDDLLDLVGDEPRLMPHLHLSLQSGDDMILKRMKRRHSRDDATAFCAQLKSLRPDITLGADIIAGFPTETEAMFARSLALVPDCDLTFLHVFPYSPRPGTPAARMPQLAGDVIRERAKRLRAAGEAALRRRLDGEIGSTRNVLIEGPRQGRTEHFLPVAIADQLAGAVRTLKIKGHDGARLTI
jgi:threonylcarbamoyladenosine tRNA methylthiotransferase MtaB